MTQIAEAPTAHAPVGSAVRGAGPSPPHTAERGGARLLVTRARLRETMRSPIVMLPGWPLVLLFAGFPLWWIMGLGVFAPLLASVPMALYLLALRDVRLPSGFGLWLLFLVWALAGITVLWVRPTGTVAVAGLERLVPFGYRVSWYVAATVVLLYVGNMTRQQLSERRIYRLFAVLFLITVVGGYVGYFLPDLPLRSVLEVVLPSGLRSNDFFAELIHPMIAQQQDIGVEVTRPAAPYIYANDWGAAFGLLAPFFVLSWTGRDAGWRRHAFPWVALLAVPPAIFTLNRGLWLGLLVCGLFLAVRLAMTGRIVALGALVAGAVLAVTAVVVSPLGDLVQTRLDNPHSDEGRSELATRAFMIALEESPIIGFGGSRELAGNFYSIAGAASEVCPGCSPPQVGTQGAIWLLVFGHGLVGAGWFLAFVVRRLLPGLRDLSREATALCTVVVFYLTVMFVYDLLTLATFVLMIALGVLWRREVPVAAPATEELL